MEKTHLFIDHISTFAKDNHPRKPRYKNVETNDIEILGI